MYVSVFSVTCKGSTSQQGFKKCGKKHLLRLTSNTKIKINGELLKSEDKNTLISSWWLSSTPTSQYQHKSSGTFGSHNLTSKEMHAETLTSNQLSMSESASASKGVSVHPGNVLSWDCSCLQMPLISSMHSPRPANSSLISRTCTDTRGANKSFFASRSQVSRF